ncbi:glycerol kinase [Culicoidibacter larvae]|uniref:ATP:glycerol 3-phosphotransferase n=2 Tax=Culicoidibacter larvae TaxID=2579976 RepID=A0A5R8QCG5_9FIRM|nr:glycerol kinase [Culicoidibacter larvae]
MMDEYRVVIDQSTSGTKCLLVKIDAGIEVVERLDCKHQQIYPQEAWVEHDPMEIVDNVYRLLDELIDRYPGQITSISITNQRETIVAWHKSTGEPLANALVWQCIRSQQICEQLISAGYEATIRAKTGLKIDSYFSGPKLRWLFENNDEYKLAMQAGDLAVGTMDAWLIWNLTGGRVFATEPSNASRTLLFDIHRLAWDQELMELFRVTPEMLPIVLQSADDFGDYRGIPIISVMADSQAALFGQQCLDNGEIKATLGTGCSVMMQLGTGDAPNSNTMMTTIAWQQCGRANYALEGIIRSCGDTLIWAQENLQLFDSPELATQLAFELDDSNGVFFIPAQLGLAAPFWRPGAQAAVIGMTRSTTNAHVIRAVFDSIVYQIKAVIDEMEQLSSASITKVRLDGGVTKNQQLMQYLSSVLNRVVAVSETEELSALGALAIPGAFSINNKYTLYTPERIQTNYHQWKGYADMF